MQEVHVPASLSVLLRFHLCLPCLCSPGSHIATAFFPIFIVGSMSKKYPRNITIVSAAADFVSRVRSRQLMQMNNLQML